MISVLPAVGGGHFTRPALVELQSSAGRAASGRLPNIGPFWIVRTTWCAVDANDDRAEHDEHRDQPAAA
jgi:hypothetical protein